MPDAANSVVTSPIMPEIIGLPHLILEKRIYQFHQFSNRRIKAISSKVFRLSKNHKVLIVMIQLGG